MNVPQDDEQFSPDEISRLVKDVIEKILEGNSYNANLVQTWTSSVVDNCLMALTKEQKPYKYVCTAMIMQKVGAGLHTASACYWIVDTDGSCTVRWENKTMHCIVSVFGLSV